MLPAPMEASLRALLLHGCFHLCTAQLAFQAPQFQSGMVLQRGGTTKVWGSGATAGATVQVKLTAAPQQQQEEGATSAATVARADGSWVATLPTITASRGNTLAVADGHSKASLTIDVGDVLLCGGEHCRSAALRPHRCHSTLTPHSRLLPGFCVLSQAKATWDLVCVLLAARIRPSSRR